MRTRKLQKQHSMFTGLPKDVGVSGTYPADAGDADDEDNKNPTSANFSSTGARAVYDMSSAQSSSWADDDESYSRLIHIASDVTLLGGVLGRDNQTTALEEVVGSFLRQGTYAGITIYVTLLAIMVGVAPVESYQYMNRTEQVANAVAIFAVVQTHGGWKVEETDTKQTRRCVAGSSLVLHCGRWWGGVVRLMLIE